MGAFSDALASVPKPKLGAPSKLDEIRASMDDVDRKAFDAALVDPSVNIAHLWRVLRSAGFDVSQSTVRGWVTSARG